MSPHDAARIMLRLAALWPRERTDDELREWQQVLRPFEFEIADRAMNDLRDTSTWTPSIAQFRRAYREAAARPAPRNALSGKVADLKEVYGSGDWTYCWKCDRAISLDDQADSSGFDPERGLFHQRCPEVGPMITAAERLARSEWYERHRILAAPAGR